MRHLTKPSLVQIMACRLVGAKLLSGPMLEYCLLDPMEQISMKFPSKYNTTISLKKIHLKTSSGKWWLFCLGLNMLTNNINVLVSGATNPASGRLLLT